MERTRKKYHYPADLKHDLLEKAIDIVRNEGADALTLKNLATSLGVTSAAMYHHYPDKSALLMAILERRFSEFNVLLREKAFGLQDDVETFLLKTAMIFFSFCTENPEFPMLMANENLKRWSGIDSSLMEKINAIIDPLMATIEKGQNSGLFRAGSKDILLIMFSSVVIGFSAMVIRTKSLGAFKELEIDQIKPYYFELICNVISAIKHDSNSEVVKSQFKVFEKELV